MSNQKFNMITGQVQGFSVSVNPNLVLELGDKCPLESDEDIDKLLAEVMLPHFEAQDEDELEVVKGFLDQTKHYSMKTEKKPEGFSLMGEEIKSEEGALTNDLIEKTMREKKDLYLKKKQVEDQAKADFEDKNLV